MHKTSIEMRFFVASPMSPIKLPAKAITSAFQYFCKHIKNYNDNYRFLTGVNTFWVSQNSRPAVDPLSKLKKKEINLTP